MAALVRLGQHACDERSQGQQTSDLRPRCRALRLPRNGDCCENNLSTVTERRCALEPGGPALVHPYRRRGSTDASSSKALNRPTVASCCPAPAGGASRTNGKHHRPIGRTGSVAVSLRRSVILSSFLAHGIRHCCAALPKRLFMASRGVLRSLMLDFGIKFRAYENDNR
jgi:hypothetical protein